MYNALFLEHCIDHTVGGSHYCLLEICRELRTAGVKCTVVFYEENDLHDDFVGAGASVVLMQPPKSWTREEGAIRGIASRIWHAFASRVELLVWRPLLWAKMLKTHEIDVVHLNNSFSHDLDAYIASRITGRSVVAHVRGIQRQVPRSSVWFGNRMDAIIAISRAVKTKILDHGIAEDQIELINDGISPDRLKTQPVGDDVRLKHGIPQSATIVGTVGNVKVWKGQKVLVEAFCEVAAEFDDAYCLIVGAIADERYYEEVVQIADKAGLADRFVFAGYQKQVSDYMRIFDVFVHSSIEPEPFGIVILEAMSLRVPVIATSIGAPREIVEAGVSGLLFDPKYPADLAKAIRSLLSNAGKRAEMGEAGEQTLHQRFTSEMNARKIMDVHLQAMR